MADTKDVTIYRFILQDGVDPEILETLLSLALKESELIYGKARMKLETNYQLNCDSATCDIDGGTECGEHLAKLLSGFLIRQIGEEGFCVERMEKKEWRKNT